LNCLIENALDHKNFLEDAERLAMLHLKQKLMMDHRNRTIADRHNLDFAIVLDLMVTMVDYLFVIVVDSIANDFVLVDLFVDYNMDNVVVE
jgi:hypothetical protein